MNLSEKMLKRITDYSVERAQRFAREFGIEVGSQVAHPSDPIAYTLKKIENGKAIVELCAKNSPTQKTIIKEFPANEIFDPNVAEKIAIAAIFIPPVPS